MPRLLTAAAAAAALLAPVPAAGAHESPTAHAVRAQVNALRAAEGAPALRPSRGLALGARDYSRSMARAGVLTHGSSWAGRVHRHTSAPNVGETLAVIPTGRAMARRLVAAWLASPPHRAVLLDPQLRRIGLGRSRGRAGWFVTADLAG